MQIWQLLIGINWISWTKEMNPIMSKSMSKLVWLPYICLLFFGFSNVYHSVCVWPTALKLGCFTNFDMLFLIMTGFNGGPLAKCPIIFLSENPVNPTTPLMRPTTTSKCIFLRIDKWQKKIKLEKQWHSRMQEKPVEAHSFFQTGWKLICWLLKVTCKSRRTRELCFETRNL